MPEVAPGAWADLLILTEPEHRFHNDIEPLRVSTRRPTGRERANVHFSTARQPYQRPRQTGQHAHVQTQIWTNPQNRTNVQTCAASTHDQHNINAAIHTCRPNPPPPPPLTAAVLSPYPAIHSRALSSGTSSMMETAHPTRGRFLVAASWSCTVVTAPQLTRAAATYSRRCMYCSSL